MLQQVSSQRYKVVLEEIYTGPWTPCVRWGYLSTERTAEPLLCSRTVDPDQAALLWPEDAVALILQARAQGIPAHLEPPIVIKF